MRLLAFLALLAASPLVRAAELADALLGLGVPEETCVRLEDAAFAAEDVGEIGPLVPLFEDGNPLAAAVASACALGMDRDAAMAEIRKRIAAGTRPEPLIAACATDFDPETASYLAAIADGNDASQAEVARFAVRVLTRREPPDGGSWAAWWSANRHTIPVREPDSTAKLLKRIRSAAAKSAAGFLRDAASRFEALTDAPAPGNDKIAGVFASLGGMMLKGAEFEPDPRAEDGDALFAKSRFAEAAAYYREALESEPTDFRTRLMLGCALIEMGEIGTAQSECERAAAEVPASSSARFLATLCARRLTHPGEDFSDAALHAWARTDRKSLAPGMPWEGDPVLETFFAQAVGGGGPMQRDPEAIARVAAEDPADAALALGCALIQPAAARGPILDALLERFPGDPAILVARLGAFGGCKFDADAMLALADRWVASQPGNAYAALIRLGIPMQSGSRIPPPPLAEHEIAAIESALALPDFDTCNAALNTARRRALEAIHHPFDNHPGTNLSLPIHAMYAVTALYKTAKAARESGDTALAERCAAALEKAADRFAPHATTILDLEYARIAARMAENARTGIESPKDSRPDHSLGEAVLEIVPLALLPLPTLHRTLVAEITENEPAVAKRWKSIPSRTPPFPPPQSP